MRTFGVVDVTGILQHWYVARSHWRYVPMFELVKTA